MLWDDGDDAVACSFSLSLPFFFSLSRLVSYVHFSSRWHCATPTLVVEFSFCNNTTKTYEEKLANGSDKQERRRLFLFWSSFNEYNVLGTSTQVSKKRIYNINSASAVYFAIFYLEFCERRKIERASGEIFRISVITLAISKCSYMYTVLHAVHAGLELLIMTWNRMKKRWNVSEPENIRSHGGEQKERAQNQTGNKVLFSHFCVCRIFYFLCVRSFVRGFPFSLPLSLSSFCAITKTTKKDFLNPIWLYFLHYNQQSAAFFINAHCCWLWRSFARRFLSLSFPPHFNVFFRRRSHIFIHFAFFGT